MSKARKVCRVAASLQHGFTMLEVLVTLVIIAVALLGTAGLQSYALKMNQGGQLRTQAVILGMDILERIEANNDGAVTGNYVAATLPTSAAVDCNVDPCTASALATYDLVQFNTKLGAQLPGSSATISVSGTGPWIYTLQITWVERITRGAKTTTTTTGTTTVTGSGQTETFAYTVSRTVYNRSLVI